MGKYYLLFTQGTDWNADRHIQISTTPKERDYINNLKDVLSWEITNIIQCAHVDAISNKIKKPIKFGKIKASEIFTIKSATPSYDKGDLEPVLDGESSYDYITRTSENQGICDTTGFISDIGKQPAGTFSLGLMQKIFFYRKREWYAGQFVKVIECKDHVPENAKIYLQTVLNGLTPYLVRDIEKVFLDSDLLLPLKEDNSVDYEWMSYYVKTGYNSLLSNIPSSTSD